MKLRHGTVVAYVALFVALGGTATALQGKNSVFSDDIAPKNVKTADIAPQAVKPKHLKVLPLAAGTDTQILVTGIQQEVLNNDYTPGTTGSAGEFWYELKIPYDAEIGNLDVEVAGGDSTPTFTLMKNEVATAVSCSGDYFCSDSDYASFQAGDGALIKVTGVSTDDIVPGNAVIALAIRPR